MIRGGRSSGHGPAFALLLLASAMPDSASVLAAERPQIRPEAVASDTLSREVVLVPGDRLMIERSRKLSGLTRRERWVIGDLLAMDADSVHVDPRGAVTSQAIPLAQVQSLYVSRGVSRSAGAGRGALLGALLAGSLTAGLATLAGGGLGPSDAGDVTAIIAGGAVVGAVVGGTIGALTGAEKWVWIPLRQRR